MTRFEPATGRQGLLPLALARSGGQTVEKHVAWELLAEWARLRAACPTVCRWPRSCVVDGCWVLEQAAPYIGPTQESEPGPADKWDRVLWATFKAKVP